MVLMASKDQNSMALTPMDAANGATNVISNVGTNSEWSEAQEWHFGDTPIRTVLRNGEPWFVLIDVCHVLDIGNAAQAAGRLKSQERYTLTINEGIRRVMPDLGNQVQSLIIISESGFYRIVMRSNKPEAERFQSWASEVVFPQIRKTGSFVSSPQPVQIDPATAMMDMLRDPSRALALIGDYATRLIAADARVEQVAMQRDEAAAKADTLALAHERFASHEGTFAITVAAKTLDIPPKKLFAWLAANSWIYRPGGRGEYVAYQTKIQQGLMVMATLEIKRTDGNSQEISRARVTTKGLDRIAIALTQTQNASEKS